MDTEVVPAGFPPARVTVTAVRDIRKHLNEEVEIRGWLQNRRSSGKVQFLLVRDGTGVVQAVVAANNVSAEEMVLADHLTQESSVIVTGAARADARAPGGAELTVTSLRVVHLAADYPITPKEHGIEFLLDHRHLWLRAPRQVAVMRVRAQMVRALREWLDGRGFVEMTSPILTPSSCEGTSTLFETMYFDRKAYLTQSGQLYAEAAAMALGRVYTFGPTFRAEKSKTRRHMNEFWMLEPEMSYCDQAENMVIQEELISYVVAAVLDRCKDELAVLERDLAPLLRVTSPFPRITYDEAVLTLKRLGIEFNWGDDFGTPHELAITGEFDRPVFVVGFPTAIKAFYMQPYPDRPEIVLAADLLAPEGYGEIIGGSQRIHDLALLEERLRAHGLPRENYEWYLDLRRYGSVPHAGFGLGIERLVAWICRLDHVREAIPFPRLLNRVYP
jgi:asparaginyl-tRNA synthetase